MEDVSLNQNKPQGQDNRFQGILGPLWVGSITKAKDQKKQEEEAHGAARETEGLNRAWQRVFQMPALAPEIQSLYMCNKM
jgi:hypothetical protein